MYWQNDLSSPSARFKWIFPKFLEMLGTFGWVSSWPSGLSLPILPLSVLWRWYMELCIRWDCVWAAKDGSFSDWTYMISTILQVQSKLQPSWRRKAGRLAANQKVTGLVRWLASDCLCSICEVCCHYPSTIYWKCCIWFTQRNQTPSVFHLNMSEGRWWELHIMALSLT